MREEPMPFSTTPPVVVIVNDDPTQLHLLSAILRKSDMSVHSYLSAEEALVWMDSSEPPSVIITDLYMPEVDSWRFCWLLRSKEYAAFNEVPILVVSATYAGDEIEGITTDLGVNAFMSSPVEPLAFVATVQRLVNGETDVPSLRVLVVEDSKYNYPQFLDRYLSYEI